MGTNLDKAIKQLYDAFAHEPKPWIIDACPCCLSPEELKVLVQTPLRQLTADQLSKYASSVFLTAGSEPDYRYLLPRILDLSLHGAFSWPDHEVVGKSLANAHWSLWPTPLRDSITQAFLAALEQAIPNHSGWEVDELICGFALTGMDIAPFLTRLEAADAEQTLIEFYERNAPALRKGSLANNFWESHETEAAPLIAWFGSAKIMTTINTHYDKT